MIRRPPPDPIGAELVSIAVKLWWGVGLMIPHHPAGTPPVAALFGAHVDWPWGVLQLAMAVLHIAAIRCRWDAVRLFVALPLAAGWWIFAAAAAARFSVFGAIAYTILAGGCIWSGDALIRRRRWQTR